MTLAPQPLGEHAGHAGVCGIDQDGCITCGDVALPLRVERVDHDRMLALCASESGETETVEIVLVGEVKAGDELLVHAGTAIAHLGSASEVSA
ncbi:MAG: HypC/HybG/HupF family hydrogenase formation chaperone [Actinomycetota bacterium]|nr:HypC/HybG/HupF family hydrogenase formation chaperone [Actinomycetota bacterium]